MCVRNFISFGTIALLWAFGVCFAKEPSFVLPHRGCYFASWGRYRPGQGQYLPHNIDPTLCTILLYAFGQITNNELATYDWKDEDNFKELAAMKYANPGLKVVLSVGGWTLSHQFPSMAATAATRAAFINSCVRKLRLWDLDGIDLDWEYPTLEQKDDFSILIQDLRAAFEDESQQTGKTRLVLGAAVAAVRTDGYDIPILERTLDFINVMTYDFHGSGWEPSVTGHNAPLYPSSVDPLNYSISGALEKWQNLGMAKSKLNVGLAFYGRAWTLADPNDHGIGARANGPSPPGPITREAGVYGFNEICPLLQSGKLTRIFDDEIQAPYAYGGNLWIGYDDEESITIKARFIVENGFAGGFLWELSNDDFNGLCNVEPNILLRTLRSNLKNRENCQALESKPSPTLNFTNRPKTTVSTTRQPTLTNEALGLELGKPLSQNGTLSADSGAKKWTGGKAAHCNGAFCSRKGAGSFAVGSCKEVYCDCDAGGNAFPRDCPGHLIFDALLGFCNWRALIPKCTAKWTTLFDPKFYL